MFMAAMCVMQKGIKTGCCNKIVKHKNECQEHHSFNFINWKTRFVSETTLKTAMSKATTTTAKTTATTTTTTLANCNKYNNKNEDNVKDTSKEINSNGNNYYYYFKGNLGN